MRADSVMGCFWGLRSEPERSFFRLKEERVVRYVGFTHRRFPALRRGGPVTTFRYRRGVLGGASLRFGRGETIQARNRRVP
jgi:hypothetical protein